jgi:hypothetical protein
MSDHPNEHDHDDPARPRGGPPTPSARPTTWLVVCALVVAIIAVGVVVVTLPRASATPRGTIAVTGAGTVRGTPDTVSFQIGVQTVAASAVQALTRNDRRLSSLEASLRARGVGAQDLQTSGLDIYENTNNRGAVTGFTVSDNLDVTMHDIGRAGAAIDSAVHAVGNGVELSGVSFSLSNDSTYLAAARAQAMRNARRAASQIAAAGGARLGAIERITDQENATPVVDPFFSMRAAGLASGVPLAAGSQSVSVQVSVIYALNA